MNNPRITRTTNTIKCPILLSESETNFAYEQLTFEYEKYKVVITYSINKTQLNKTAIYFLPGKGNYWFYNHVRRHYPDYDFFSIDLPGFGFNANYETGLYTYENSTTKKKFTQPNNYYDDMDLVFEMLNNSLLDLKTYLKTTYLDKSYPINNLMGFSTGGFIALYHIWKLQILNSKPNPNPDQNSYFPINKLLLISPLTRFYFGSKYMDIGIHLLNNFISLFSYKFDYGIFRSKNNSNTDEINRLLNSIYENEAKVDAKPKPTEINIQEVLLGDNKSITSGYITTTENTIQKMINSEIKINIPVRMVCSNNFATSDSLYDTDSSLKPDYMLKDIIKICENNKFYHSQFECGHDAMCEPHNNYQINEKSDKDDISYQTIMDDLFEKNQS
jgi:pimeloyl-ACP methyl ester carboxylesterase